MKVLVIGSGGREHALAWKIAQSPQVEALYCAPGNGGTAQIAVNVPLKETDIESLARYALEQQIDLTVIGPELPLMLGLVDYFQERGLRVFGPTQAAARLEGSKVFAKEFMQAQGIPTAPFTVCSSPEECTRIVAHKSYPFVLKVDGLAAGKGALVIHNAGDLRRALHAIWEEGQFGAAAEKVIVEDFLPGEELSVLVVSDGQDYVILPAAQDHKRVFDADQGPNTGGMGAYAPAPLATPELLTKVKERIIEPTLQGMRTAGTPYKGVLYCGLMVHQGEPAVVEFNARFGDPETQVVLPLITSDFTEILSRAVEGTLRDYRLEIAERYAVCVVMASAGYPGSYQKGYPITGLTDITATNVQVFHAGTSFQNGQWLTNGGRVLGVTAWDRTLATAVAQAYQELGKIDFTGKHYRRDIAQKGLRQLSENP